MTAASKHSQTKLCPMLWGSALCWIGRKLKIVCLGKAKRGLECSISFKAHSPEMNTGTAFLPARPWHYSPSKSQGIDSVIKAIVPKCCSFPEWGRLQPFLPGYELHTHSVAASGHRLFVPHELPAWVSAHGVQCHLAAPADTSKSALWPVRCLEIICRKKNIPWSVTLWVIGLIKSGFIWAWVLWSAPKVLISNFSHQLLFRADPRKTGRPWAPPHFGGESTPGSKYAHSGLLTQKFTRYRQTVNNPHLT